MLLISGPYAASRMEMRRESREVLPAMGFTRSDIDAGDRSENFFYSRSELSCSPVTWFRAGTVVDRTRALGSNFDIRRGPLVGFKYKKVDFTTYWLSPGSRDATFIFTVAVNF